MDPNSLNPDSDTDPDPAVQVNPDPDPVRIQGFDDQKRKKKNTDLIKNFNLLMSRLQEKLSALKKEHPALQNMTFLNFFVYFCGSFLPSSGSGSTDLIGSGSGSETPDIFRRWITTAAAPPAAGSS